MIALQRIVVEGKRFVLLPESEYDRLCGRASETVPLDDAGLPPLPKPDKNGRFPAVQYARVSLARDIIRDRKAIGLTQTQLARLAGIRQETLSRIESGRQSAAVKTVERIERALAKAKLKSAAKSKSAR
jgi:DNA-binding XRE family transcriptional regulator